jgi:HD-GYP domain-containing protein (c-di-GMP phosphodiesterase class II)
MTTDRPYRKALPHVVAMGELERFAGKQFDASVVKVFREVIEHHRQERIELGLVVPL